MTDTREIQDRVQEIGKGVRRHRSDVLRRPRSHAPRPSPPVVSEEVPSLTKDNSSNNESMAPLSSSAHHVLENLHRDVGKEAAWTEHAPERTSEKRRRDRVRNYADLWGDEEAHEREESMMDKNGKNIVYVRRGEGDKKPNGRDEGRDFKSNGRVEGKESRRDERRDGHKYEGKFIRKRVERDRRSDERGGPWKSSRHSEDVDDSGDGENGKASGSGKRTERSWKEIAEREEGRNRILKIRREKEKDVSEKPYAERRDKGGRERPQSFSEKGAKHGKTGLPTKLKLKVGGIVRTLHSDAPKNKQDPTSVGSDSKTSERRFEKLPEPTKKRRQRLILQENSDDDDYDPRAVLIKKDANPLSPSTKSKEVDVTAEDNSNRIAEDLAAADTPTQVVRKSSRVPKKKVLEDFADDIPDEDKTIASYNLEPPVENTAKSQEYEEDYGKNEEASDKDVSISDDESEDLEDESDRPSKAKKRKSLDNNAYPGKGRNAPLTARQRTLQLGKDGEADVGESLIEFPTGLSHSTTRRGREKLTDEERQVKKAEAARRRKQLVEKAAKEIQATAIQKILGQDSSRKKKEERLQKQRKEIEQGKIAAALEPATNSIRWSLKPGGTIVSWSLDVELPTIFSSGPSCYPPARENCAGPSCTNPYKYRDSKSSLPLCSLQCYRAIQVAPALISA